MNIHKSRNGFYTLTFVNNYNLTPRKIFYEFNTVGAAKVNNLFNRYFIRYTKKEEAEKAILKYGKIYNVTVAIESEYRSNQNKVEKSSQNKIEPQPLLKISHNLILGNLPKNYTIEDIKYLIEEIHYYDITEVEETIFLKLKFCRITLSSEEHLKYLIQKLDKFILHGEKLIAIDEKNLLSYSKLLNEKFNKINVSSEES